MSDQTRTRTIPADRWNTLTQARRDFAELSLNGWEQAADAVLAHERKLAEAIPVDWLREAMIVRTAMLTEAKAAYVRFARSLARVDASTN